MKVVTVVGARPQLVKAWPVSRALERAGLREVLVHTGQHHDRAMSDVFFEELGMAPPDHHLGIHGGLHGAMTGRMLEAIEAVLVTEAPQIVLVYGDTNSTLAGALAAAKLNISVAHVEAGLRSFNRRMPEEVNRVLTDHVSRLLFCPTDMAVANLAREGVTAGVHRVGDVMYDATLMVAERVRGRRIVSELGLVPGGFALATLHRAASTDDAGRLARLVGWLRGEAAGRPVVMPLHPRTRAALAEHGLATDGLRLIEPVGYLDMHALLAGAALVFTDSGGVQKEAYFHGVPCVTLRDETEWVETIAQGWNRLWTVPDYAPRRPIDEYGDGHAADRIAAILAESDSLP